MHVQCTCICMYVRNFFICLYFLCDHVAVCAVNFFKSGEQCVACPTGSERTGDNEDSCMCTGNLVTDGGVDTTTGALCDSE